MFLKCFASLLYSKLHLKSLTEPDNNVTNVCISFRIQSYTFTDETLLQLKSFQLQEFAI
jgi:hypothetical protein